MKNTYSVSHLAKEFGLDRRTLDARLAGVPFATGAKNSKEYTLRAILDAFIAHAEGEITSKKKPKTDEEKNQMAEDLLAARLRKENAEADLAEIKVAKEQGKLIEADRVSELWSNLVYAMRAKMLSLPGRASVQTAGLPQLKVELRLEEMVREALDELSRQGDEFEEPDDVQSADNAV